MRGQSYLNTQNRLLEYKSILKDDIKGVKTLKMTSNKIKISNLTPKRVYYIRVRPFAMYENREEVYGAFSKIMKITVK